MWVTYGEGVYDVTDFLPLHPGADKLLLAAGGSIEPFWDILAVHKENQAIHDRLESYRIGNIKKEISEGDGNDPFLSEPVRGSELLIRNHKPFVGETPVDVLCGDFITPTDLFFVRNHLPVPDINPDQYSLEVSGIYHNHNSHLTLKYYQYRSWCRAFTIFPGRYQVTPCTHSDSHAMQCS